MLPPIPDLYDPTEKWLAFMAGLKHCPPGTDNLEPALRLAERVVRQRAAQARRSARHDGLVFDH